ncbi:MAG: protein phosphatase 2C domain-containing protein [Synergistaceae bacterium]|jgi:protein phosphatase|nr:protein phosphatase 2C domain-containing protein [Synergistaceae bacterium]
MNVYGNYQNIGTREEQQDSFGWSKLDDDEFIGHGGKLSIICDGMGGLQNGREASLSAIQAFRDAYMSKGTAESIPDALHRAVQYTNEQVLALAKRIGQEGNCGSTLVAAVLHKDCLYWISVGDSHIYLWRGSKLQLLNKEHIYANTLDKAVREGILSEEDASMNPDREALTSYIGIPELKEIDSGSMNGIPPGAGVVLCSDGLYKVLSDTEMSRVFDPDAQKWAENLISATLKKGKAHQDNITVTVLLREGAKKRRKPEFFFIAMGSVLLLLAGVLFVLNRPTVPIIPEPILVISGDDTNHADPIPSTLSDDPVKNNIEDTDEKPYIERIEPLPDLIKEEE